MSLGPILIFDKSTLQSLNVDEAVWLDNFFMTNITPLFFIETLADLEKEVRKGKTPEQVVGEIAYKTPDMSPRSNVHHMALVWGELLGKGKIEMRGLPILGRGQVVILEGCTGVVYKESPESEAFNRWREGEFLEVERGYAKQWRRELESVDLKAQKESFQGIWEKAGKPRTFEEIKALADNIIDGPEQLAVLRLGLTLMMFNGEWVEQIIAHWQSLGQPRIRDYAPYFTHVLTVDLFFYLSIAAGLIGSDRKSNRADIAYLYYLPFCMVFTSKDNLHVRVVPHFLRADQSFVNGNDLKNDLRKLDEHYSALPEEIKEQGLYGFATYPPDDDSYLVTKLWKKHMKPHSPNEQIKPPAFEGKTLHIPPAGSAPEEIVRVLNDFEARAVPAGPKADFALENAAVVTFQSFIRQKKGKWKRVPDAAVQEVMGL
jgi:hypothetical protein